MPKFYRQNKKRKNPRYFLNENILNDAAQYRDILCNDMQRTALFAVMRNFPKLASEQLAQKAADSINKQIGNNTVSKSQLSPVIEFILQNGGASESIEDTIKSGCSVLPF